MDNLRLALRLNAASCLLFGVLFLSRSGRVAQFVGTASVTAVQLVGAGLLGNGIHLIAAAWRTQIRPAEVFYFSAGDLLWVSATLGMIASGSFLTTPTSATLAIVVAAFVGLVGIRQLWALSKEQPLPPSGDRLSDTLSVGQAIVASWIAMKPWVKYWLATLNATFLLSVILLPDALARYTLAAYVASGPWLLAFMVYQRGLTRLLGVAHLVPWTPLAVYLAVRVGSDGTGDQLTRALDTWHWRYAVLLTAMICICLAFDIVDVWRWIGGERYRLGSVNAARAGASALATDV